jgi:hypothetical protein
MSKRQGEPHLDRTHHSKMLKTDGKARLRVLHTDQYKGPTPRYEQPREINSYSIDHIRHVWFDNRQLVRTCCSRRIVLFIF